MKLNKLLRVEEPIALAETSYQHNTHIARTMRFLQNIVSELSQLDEPVRARVLVVEDKDGTYALALYNPPDTDEPASWTLLTSLLDQNNKKRFNELTETLCSYVLPEGILRIQADRQELIDAIREYYSSKLLESAKALHLGTEFVYNKPRVERLKKIIQQLEASHRLDLSGNVLEICCGNGMATAALRELGIQPLCMDNDSASLAEGLAGKVLSPNKTVLGDATELVELVGDSDFDAVVGFMLGDIDDFNKYMWQEILLQAAKVTKPGGSLFFTLRTQKEAEFVKEALKEAANGEILCPNDTEALYDRWIYIGKKKTTV